MLATAFGDLPSVDLSGQLDVRHQDVGDPLLAPFQRLFSIAGLDYVVAFLPQRLDNDFADKRVVLDEKYAHGGSSRLV